MAIHQQAGAEAPPRVVQQARQGGVVRLPAAAHPGFGVGEAQLAPVDAFPGRHHARDGAQARADPGGGGVHPRRQRVVEHGRVEFPRLAVRVAVGAGEGGGQQGHAVTRRVAEQLVHEGVLAAAQAHGVEPGRGEELRRVVAPGMGGGEHERRRLALRRVQPVGRVLGPGGFGPGGFGLGGRASGGQRVVHGAHSIRVRRACHPGRRAPRVSLAPSCSFGARRDRSKPWMGA